MVTFSAVPKELRSMEHELEDGPISIVRVVNPCLYWIRCYKCFSVAKIQKILLSSDLTTISEIKRGDRVVVRCFNGQLYRGVVQCPSPVVRGQKEAGFKVFLVDALDTLIVEPEQLFTVKIRTCLDDLSPQLHLVGIDCGKPLGNLESEIHLDENSHNVWQREQVLMIMKKVESIHFIPKRKCDSVTFGKMKLSGKDYNNRNLLKVLIRYSLAEYRENFTSALLMSEWMDKVIEEQKAIEGLLTPPPLTQSPKKESLKNLPPPPEVVFDQKQVLRLKDITSKFGFENLLDKIGPIPKVESFNEMNDRYRASSRYEAILRKNDQGCQEKKFEYSADGSSLVGSFVNVEVVGDRYRRVYPPTSSDEDYVNSSLCSTPSVDLSSHESDLTNEKISSSDSDIPRANHRDLTQANARLKNDEKTSLEKQVLNIKNESPESSRNVVASDNKTSSECLFENKGNAVFGRGKLFQKYLPAFKNRSTIECDNNASVVNTTGQFNDNHADASRQDSRVFPFDPDTDSVIDIDGFLDEASDTTDEYCDVLRMNENGNPSLVETLPGKSSPTESLLRPSPVPTSHVPAIRTGELSGEESVPSVPLSRSSSVISNVNLPDLLPINKRRMRQKGLSNPKSNGDSDESSSQGMLGSVQKAMSTIDQGKQFEEKLEESINLDSYQPGTDEIERGCALPRSKFSAVGRGKLFVDHINPQRPLGGFSPGTSVRTLTSVESPNPNEVEAVGTNISPKISVPIKGFGRGHIFKKPLGLTELPSPRPVQNVLERGSVSPDVTTPSKIIFGNSTPQNIEKGDTKTELDSSIKKDNPLQAKLEAVLKKMEVQADPDSQDDGTSESESSAPPQPSPKLVLSEFVKESDIQEPASDGEEEPEVEPTVPQKLSDCSMNKRSHVLTSGAGLLHGATDILPANYLSNLDIDELIYRNARHNKIDFLTRWLYFGIPAVLTLKNVVFVGPNKTNKSSAFVIPLLSLLMNEEYYSTLRRGNGPRCVFVAPTSSRVKALVRLCSAFCGARLTTIQTYGGGLELERKNELAAGCDILITTPRCWLRLLQYPTVTNLSRLCHLVLDRFDTLADLFPRELKQISAKIIDLATIRARKNEALSVQMILSAELWSPAVEEVATKLLNKPVLIIMSYLEAMLYARIRPNVTLVKMDDRFNKLLDLVQMHSSMKVIIMCATANDVIEVRKACSTQYIPIVAHRNMATSLIAEVKPQWDSSKCPPMLICSDDVLSELGITDAQVLIHFSLPENKTSFSERFAVLRDHLPDRILNPKVNPPNCIVYIMFDEASEAPFPFIVDFLRRISVKIPTQVLETVKTIRREKEEGKITAPFCEKLLQLGSCYKTSTCTSRHVVLPKLDNPKGQLASKGLIKVQIVHVHSAVKYSARILAHNPNLNGSGPWTTYKSEFVSLTLKMGSYYASNRNRRQHGRPKVGDFLAYQEDLDQPFFRARVVQITKRDDRQEPSEVLIFLVDEGIEKISLMHTLFELPEDLKKVPDQAVFIYLANLRPVDLDTTWSFAAMKMVEKAVHASEMEDVANQDIIGKILFTIGRNCVVENLRWCRRMTYSQCFTLDLRQLLLSSGCGIDNPEYSTNFTELCSSANLEFGLYRDAAQVPTCGKEIVLEEENREPPRWAHLSHEKDFILVHNVVDYSPSLFYIKMERFHQNLKELEKDLSAELNKNKENLKVKGLKVGNVCATRILAELDNETETSWNRCIVYGISGKDADIFTVDYGDKHRVPIQNLYSIPWKFVIKLPFQAIECKLAGVLPVQSSEDEWSQVAIDEFRELISKGDYSGKFHVKVMNLDLKGLMTGGRRYHVILIDGTGDSPVMINKKFCEMGFGVMPSLDMDEADLLDAYHQIKELDSRQDDGDTEEEDWDAVYSPPDGSACIPTRAIRSLLAKEEKGNLKPLDLNFEELELKDLMVFAQMLDIEKLIPTDHVLCPKSTVLPITAGPAQPEDEVSESRVTQEADESPDLEKCHKHESPILLSCMNDSDHPLLVRCAPLKTPLVHWRQDASTITIKYMIPCLRNYKIDVNFVSVSFRAIVNNDSATDEYWKQINLFGPVLENSVSESLTVTCLRITIFKRIQGYLWPRLTHLDSKHLRINVDPEDPALLHHEEQRENFDEHFERGYKTFKSRGVRLRKKCDELNKVQSRPAGDEENYDDDDEEEFFEPDDDTYDFFNPLA